MSSLLLALSAVAAGLVSFSSPCCLPLVPGYLSYVAALPVEGMTERAARRETARASVHFVLGFTFVFTLLGLGASAVGNVLLRNQDAITRWFGVPIVFLGLSSMGILRIPLLQREGRIFLGQVPRGPRWAFPLGMAFAAGWTPCIGPVLATILATASVRGSMAWGAALLALYGLGLGVPFIALALGYRRAQRSTRFLARHGRTIERAGGLALVVVGLLFMSGRWSEMFRPLQRWFAELGWPPV